MHAPAALSALLTLLLAACAAAPTEPVSEALDLRTGTTTVLVSRPVELQASGPQGPLSDPFAYLAPFETNRMGRRTSYLWLAVPQGAIAESLPRIECDGQPLQLVPFTGSLAEIGLSRPPYEAPTPWSIAAYYRLPQQALHCLATARSLTALIRGSAGEDRRFTAESANFPVLADFALRVAAAE